MALSFFSHGDDLDPLGSGGKKPAGGMPNDHPVILLPAREWPCDLPAWVARAQETLSQGWEARGEPSSVQGLVDRSLVPPLN